MPQLNYSITTANQAAIATSVAPAISLGMNKIGQSLESMSTSLAGLYKSIGDSAQVGMNVYDSHGSFASVDEAQQVAAQLRSILAQIQRYVQNPPNSLASAPAVAYPGELLQSGVQLSTWSKTLSSLGDSYAKVVSDNAFLQNQLAQKPATTTGGGETVGTPTPAPAPAAAMSTGEKVGIGAAVVALGGLAWYFAARH